MSTNTLESLISEASDAEANVKQAQRTYEAKLQEIATTYGATFLHNGQWFQVRTREAGNGETITYLCHLKGDPKTWLKGRPKGSDGAKARKKQARLTNVSEEVVLNNSTHVIAEDSEPDSDTVLE